MKQNSFTQGLRDGIPICLGYLSVSFAFGLFCISGGLSLGEAVLISMTNLTSAGQLAAVPIILGGGSLVELATAQLVINLRYALMSISLSQKLDTTVNLPRRLLIGFGITDEIYAVSSAQPGIVGPKYMYGLILTPYFGWSMGTLLGAVAGNILPDFVTAALGIAIYAMLIAIVVPDARDSRPVACCVLIAVALSCLFRYLPLLQRVPSGFSIILCALVASVILSILHPVEAEKEAEE